MSLGESIALRAIIAVVWSLAFTALAWLLNHFSVNRTWSAAAGAVLGCFLMGLFFERPTPPQELRV